MGQYYYPLLIDESKPGGPHVIRAYSNDYDVGLKLMEHSWIGNKFVNSVLGELCGRAMRLAWIGDYSEDAVGAATVFSDGFCNGKREFSKWYNIAMTGSGCEPLSPKKATPYELDINNPYGFLINETKGVFLDMERYVEASKCNDKVSAWCINPVPLLTSVGNGRGGGDYRGGCMQHVGSWAFDKLRMTGIRPSCYKEIRPPVFKEPPVSREDSPFDF